MTTTPAIDPLKANFKNFLWKVWGSLGLGAPSPLQYDFADYLQHGHTRGDGLGQRKELIAFRGAAKTYVTTAYAVWRLYCDPTERILVTSATAAFAKAIATFAFMMITTFDWLAHLAPRPDQRAAAQAFDVNGAPASKDTSLTAESIFGQITGRRATLIIGDDLETPNTSDTEGNRTELRKRIGEFGAIILPGGDIVYLGTPQTEDTIYRRNHEEKGYELRIYPITYPTSSSDPKKDELRRYGANLAPIVRDALLANPELAGTSTEPVRFDEADIASRRIEWGQTEFDRQFKLFLDAGAGRGNPLKMRDLIVVDIPCTLPLKLPSMIEWAPLPANKREDITVDAMTGDSAVYAPSKVEDWIAVERTIMFVDTSGSGDDETTWTIGAESLGRVAEVWKGASLEGHTPETMRKIAEDGKRWGVHEIFVESNFGGDMFAELLAPVCRKIDFLVSITPIPAGRVQKEARIIETLEPLFTSHRYIMNAELLRQDFDVGYDHVEAGKLRYYRLSYQLTRITKQRGCLKHDDRADGSAGMAARFIGILQRVVEEAAREGRSKLIELEADKIIAARKAQGLPLFGLGVPSRFGRGTSRSRSNLV